MKELVSLVIITFCAELSTSLSPSIQYLGRVNRLQNKDFIDYYFSCSGHGNFLIWQLDDEPLSGFQPIEIGEVVVSRGSSFTYTTVLLSSIRNDAGLAYEMISLMVVSFDNVNPPKFVILCSNQDGVNSTSTDMPGGDVITHVENSMTVQNVTLDYVLSSNTVRSRNYTHIFVCGTRSDFQFLEAVGPAVGFRKNDPLGDVKTVLSSSRDTVSILGVLMANQPFSTTTLLIVAVDSPVNVRCFSDNVNSVALASASKQTSTSEVSSEMPSITTVEARHTLENKNDGSGVLVRTVSIVVVSVIGSLVIVTFTITFCLCRVYMTHSYRSYNVNRTAVALYKDQAPTVEEVSSVQATHVIQNVNADDLKTASKRSHSNSFDQR